MHGFNATSAAIAAVIVAGAMVLGPGRAHADAIDGEWCLADSHFAIDGPKIRTPGGNTIEGSYSRHGFRYIVPANEKGAGSEIVMVLLNEEMLQLTHAAPLGSPEIWRRCKPTS
jgi:hypothetical protein